MNKRVVLVSFALLAACSKPETSQPKITSASAEPPAPAPEPTKPAMRVEKVTMQGVAWEVSLPADMKAPEYKVKNPEYLGDDDLHLQLDATFPKFPSVDAYVKNNVVKLVENKQIGGVGFVVDQGEAGKFFMTAVVPNKPIGWHCSGDAKREADIRAMCTSVKFTKL